MDEQQPPTAAAIRQHLHGKRILVFSYCHADWAWEHTRAWHAARYVQILDEVLDLASQQRGFKHFADSYVEFFPPFVAARPQRAKELAEGKPRVHRVV